MTYRSKPPKEWFVCPACGAPVPRGYTSCTECGRSASDWQLISDAIALDGTRDMGYAEDHSVNNVGGKQK